uniref:NADP-dependent oxidoreductase domain-containing protein n=1 Tax=Oryza glumipatula TaxID=40148 RepID=A0A0E0AJX5_9ORYZ
MAGTLQVAGGCLAPLLPSRRAAAAAAVRPPRASGASAAAAVEEGKVRLGGSDVAVTKLGIGAWSWGDTTYWNEFQWDDRKLKAAKGAFDKSVDCGITFFDTAEVYGAGISGAINSESLLGRFIKERQQKEQVEVAIATKFAALPWRLGRGSVISALKDSLSRLGVSSVELYQLHCRVCIWTMASTSGLLATVLAMAVLLAGSSSSCQAARHLADATPPAAVPVPTVPAVTLPPMPAIPAVPAATLPPMPAVPTVPNAALPPMPAVPKVALPPMPAVSAVPTVPAVPAVPAASLPPMPAVPAVPNAVLPPMPAVPKVTLPPMPSMPAVPKVTLPPMPSLLGIFVYGGLGYKHISNLLAMAIAVAAVLLAGNGNTGHAARRLADTTEAPAPAPAAAIPAVPAMPKPTIPTIVPAVTLPPIPAVPKVTLPPMPAIPTVPAVTMPPMPAVPTVPAVTLPPMPAVPTVPPNTVVVPAAVVPALPKVALPPMAAVPNVPMPFLAPPPKA